jgi:hypothetical protein
MKLIKIPRPIPTNSQHSIDVYTHSDLFAYDPHHQDVTEEKLAHAYVQSCPDLQDDVIILRSVKVAEGKYHLLVLARDGTPRKYSKEVSCTTLTLSECESMSISLQEMAEAGFPDWIFKPDFISYWVGAVCMPQPLRRPVSAELSQPIQKGVQDVARPRLQDADNACTLDPPLQEAHENLMNAIDEVLKQYKQQCDDSGISSLAQIIPVVNDLKQVAPQLYCEFDKIQQKIDAQLNSIDDARPSHDGFYSKKRDRLIPVFIQQTNTIHDKDKELSLYKLELIWLLYVAAKEVADTILRMPDDSEKMRNQVKASMSAFNHLFADIAFLGEDKILSPVEEAYAKLAGLALEELLARANSLLPKVKSPKVKSSGMVPNFIVQAASNLLSVAMAESKDVWETREAVQKRIVAIINEQADFGKSLNIDLKEGSFVWAEQVTKLVAERKNFIVKLIESIDAETRKAADHVQKILSTFKEIRQLVRAAHLKQMEMELAAIRRLCEKIGSSKYRIRQLAVEHQIFYNGENNNRFSKKSVERIKNLNQKRGEGLPNPDDFCQLLDDAQRANDPLPLDFPHANEPALLATITSNAKQLQKARASLVQDEEYFRSEISWLEDKLVEEKKHELDLRCDANRTLYAELESLNDEVMTYASLPVTLLGGYLQDWNQAVALLHPENVSLLLASPEAREQREHRFVKAKREAIRSATTLEELKSTQDELDKDRTLLTSTMNSVSGIKVALSQIAAEQRALEDQPFTTKIVVWFKHYRATIQGLLMGFVSGGCAGAVAGAIGGTTLLPGLGTVTGGFLGFVIGGCCGALGGSGVGRVLDRRREQNQVEKAAIRALEAVNPVSDPVVRSTAQINQALAAVSPPVPVEPVQPAQGSPSVGVDECLSAQSTRRLSWGAWIASFFWSTPGSSASDQALTPVTPAHPSH